MSPDDPRHGTTRGYHAGCHEPCCRRAMARYEKAGRLARLNGGLAVPALGSQRRLQALMRLGWSSHAIAAAAGLKHRNHTLRILNGQKGKPTVWVQKSTDKWVREVYDKLSMQVPTGAHANRTRAHAERMGWPPPLAWDDIDNPNEKPRTLTKREGVWDDQIDEAVVDRVVNEMRRPRKLTRAESAEVVRILLSRGVSTHVIANDYGVKAERYVTLGDREAS